MSDLAFEQRFEQIIKEKGLDCTDDRKAICKVVSDLHTHFTEDDLIAALPSLTRDTVLTTLSLMFDAGLVRKIRFGDDPPYYEHVWGHLHHDHLWCVSCGTVIEFHDESLEAIQEGLAERNGFLILRHQMQLIGLCKNCRDKAPEYAFEYHHAKHAGPMAPLSTVKDGRTVTIAAIHGGRRMKQRLVELGLLKGEKVTVVQNRFAGPFIVNVKGSKLALGHGLAHHIQVRDDS
jgi:Fur family transcriptional regulator, ferric uptake regulator